LTPETWARVKVLFEHAVALDPERRGTFLDEACAESELRRQVEILLASDAAAADFLETAARVEARPPGDGEPLEGALGPYRILRVVGRGGMGVVYEAVRADGEYTHRVAVKLVKRGMDTDAILQRFRNERQILARLQHPGIARLLDGGTAGDRPYLVMEYVDGRPIDAHAEERGLDVPARLALFREICSAVDYAHRSLVVHRDIKPRNILVTPEGSAKLLDFGVAKILDPEHEGQATATALRAMTPEYASPEQARGEPVTTSTDVYSLGVLLYELLAGRRPYEITGHGVHDVVRVICETEPQAPSAVAGRPAAATGPADAGREQARVRRLRRTLAGDLDTIVLTALRKEPARRYASVAEFSEDVRRYLAGLPVAARKDTLAYRAGKFVRRHTAGVAAAALVLLSLLAGVASTLWQSRMARAERTRAERRFQDVRHLANAFLFDFHDAIRDLPGSTRARQLVVDKAREYLDRLAREAGGDESLQRELAAAYVKVGDVQGRPGHPNLGDVAGALQSYGAALSIRRTLAAARPADAAAQLALAEAHGRMGEGLAKAGRVAEAVEQHRSRVAASAAAARAGADPLAAGLSLCTAQGDLAELLVRQGNAAAARDLARTAAAKAEELATGHPAHAGVRLAVAHVHGALGRSLYWAGDSAAALGHLRKSLTLLQELAAADGGRGPLRRRVAAAHTSVGDALLLAGGYAEGLDHYRRALAVMEALSAEDPLNAEARRDVGACHFRIGQMARYVGDRALTLQSFRTAASISEALVAADPANAEARRDLRMALSGQGLALRDQGDLDASAVACLRAITVAEELVAAQPSNVQAVTDLAGIHADLGKVLERKGELAAALESHRRGLALNERLYEANRASVYQAEKLYFSHGMLADTLVKAQALPDALRHYQRAWELTEPLARGAESRSRFRENLAWWESKVAEVHGLLARGRRGPAGRRHAQESCAWYRRSHASFTEVRAARPLGRWLEDWPRRVAREAARCGPPAPPPLQ
jgi:non-specific serine/threonine protein kinase/serine/threonine-protein kinase